MPLKRIAKFNATLSPVSSASKLPEISAITSPFSHSFPSGTWGMKLRLLSKSLNVRSEIGNPAMTPASLTIHLAVPWMLFAGNKADVVRSPLPISSSSQLCNRESKTIQGGNIAVMFLSVVISRGYLLGTIVDQVTLGKLQNKDGVSAGAIPFGIASLHGIWEAGAILLD